jgi:chromatin remodeling complex protein RSC6
LKEKLLKIVFHVKISSHPWRSHNKWLTLCQNQKSPGKKYKARRFFNRNHIVKSRKFGTRRKVGYRRLYKRWRWSGNPGPLILAREVRVTPEMSAIRDRASWAEITRLFWVYIKEHKLQNPDNGIFFKPDQQLATI